MGDDIEDFIRQQKAKIANDRHHLDGRQNQDTGRNGYKENIPPRGQTPEVPLVAKMVPSAENERRRKLREERNQEYNSLLHRQRLRETGRNGLKSNEGGAAIPGIVDRNSAKQRKVAERNREYNEFLEQQKEKERHRFDKSKGGSTSRKPEPEPDHSRPALSERPREPDRRERERRLEEYDRQRDSDEPPRRRRDEDDFDDRRAPPRPRPDEDEAMSLPFKDRSSAKRRAEETRNKEYNEFLETKRGKPRKGWGTPTYEEILDEKRKQERDYRRHDDPEIVYGRPMRSSYSDGHLNKSFEEERLNQLDREVEEKKVRFRNELRQPTGRGILDDRDWLEGTRGPPKSRYDPEQEFREWDRNLGDNRQRMPTAGNVELAVRPAANFNERRQRVTSAPLDGGGALPLGNEAPESIARRKEQYRRELEQQMQESAQNKKSPRGIRRETQPSYNTAPMPSAYLQNQPSLGPYNTPGDESYHYYGMVDPLAPTRTTGGGGHPAVPPLFASDRGPRVTFDDSEETTRITPRKGKYDSDMVSAAIPTVDDRDQLNEKRTKAAEYSRELERQMQEQKMKKLREKAEKEAYERKLEEEIRNYNPYGRGGGGAPLKDASGNTVADLRGHQGGVQLGGTSEELGGGGQIASTPRSVRNPDASHITPRGADGEPTHARGGHGIFGAPKTNAEKDMTEKYREELRLQIEEQKRREAERQRLEKEKEESEQKKVEEQQQRMKDEYEAELRRLKEKEDEARRANEEVKNAAEKKRLELERQRREQDEREMEEARRRQDEERLARVENTPSPPIPTLNKQPTSMSQSSKVQPELEKPIRPVERPPQSPVKPKQQRSNSPPVPSLRKDQSSRIDRAGSATILTELEKMRKQLQNERHRVESSLQKDKYQVEVFDPRLVKKPLPISSQPPLIPSTLQRPISPRDINVPNALNRKVDFDIFDAAIKNRVPATVRRPHLAGDEVHPEVLDEFQKYKNKRTPSRQNFRNDFPDQPTSGFTLEAQQLALLREQEDQLNKMRRKPFDDAFVDDLSKIPPMGDMGSKSQLQSDSAFIDMDGLPINPQDYERSSSVGSSRVPSARERRRNRESPKPSGSRTQPDNTSLGSTTSLDPERIRKKNEDRLRRLNNIADGGNKSETPPSSPKKKPAEKPLPVQEGMVNRGTSRPRSSSIEQTSPIRRPRPAKTQPTPRKSRVSTPVTKHSTARGAPPRPPKVPQRPPRDRSPDSFASTPPPRLPPPRSKRTPRRFTPSPPPPVPPRRSYSKSPDRSHPATMASPYRTGKTARRVQTPDSLLGRGADDVSLQDPDDILDRFISKQQHNRPPSGTTLGDDEEAWLRPSK